MTACDPVLQRQLPLIEKIISDEIWLEGERRGHPVDRRDRIVRENVCRVVLRMGQEMRQRVMADIAAERLQHMPAVSESAQCVAA